MPYRDFPATITKVRDKENYYKNHSNAEDVSSFKILAEKTYHHIAELTRVYHKNT